MRLIDADALYRTVCNSEELARQRFIDTPSRMPNGDQNPYAIRYATQLDERLKFKFMIADAQSVEPERKTGRWIHIRDEEDGNAFYMCSVCHKGEVHVPIVEVSYCWNCGADMRGEKHEY